MNFFSLSAGVVLLCAGTTLQAAQLKCTLSKVWFAHPYLPSSLVLEADEHFLNVKLRDVQIENVATSDASAKVVYRGQNRLRLEWPTAEYRRTGPVAFPNRNVDRDEIIDYRPTLSLNLKNLKFKLEVQDRGEGLQRGQGDGTCKRLR